MMIRAFVQITGVDPDKVTKAVGIKPDESWRKGDISSFHEGQIATVRRRKFDFWCITTQTEDPFISIGDLLRELAGRLRSVSAKISSLRNVGHVSCSVWVDFDPRVERLAFAVDEDTINFLSSIGADFDVDLSCPYDLDEKT